MHFIALSSQIIIILNLYMNNAVFLVINDVDNSQWYS